MPVKQIERSGRRGERVTGGIREIRSELRKVVWPSRQEAIKLTMIVIGVSSAVGLFLGAVDFGFAQMFQVILR